MPNRYAKSLGSPTINSNELNSIIDNKLPSGRPQFQQQEVVIQGEVFEVYFQDILQCVKVLYGDAEFAPYLKFDLREHHFEDESCDNQIYHDMHTGEWWWSTQV